MLIQMKKSREFLFLATMFLAHTVIMGNYIISPTYNLLYETYPDKLGAVNFIVSGFYAFVVAASLLAGKLDNRVSRKKLMIFGAISAALGGIGTIYNQSLTWMCIMRALYGIGYSFTQVCALTLLNEIYTNDQRRGKVVGYFNAAMNAIGAILGALAGKLASISAVSAYKLNWLMAIYAVCLIIFVPNIKPTDKTESLQNGIAGEKESMGSKYFKKLAVFLINSLSFCILVFFVSTYVSENTLGNETFAGLLNSAVTVGGFVFAMLYGKINLKLGKNTLWIMYLLSAAPLLMLKLMPAKPTALVFYFVSGGAYVVTSVYMYSYYPTIMPFSKVGNAIAIHSASTTFMTLITSYVVTFGMKFTQSYTNFLIIPLCFRAAAFVIDFMSERKQRREK